MKMSHTNLRKCLLESLINPQEPGPNKVILEANNPTYFLQRVQEILRDVQSPQTNKKSKDEKLKLAVLLIAAARLLEADNATQERPKSQSRKRQHQGTNQVGASAEAGSGNSTVSGGAQPTEETNDTGQKMTLPVVEPLPEKGKHG